jgi:hypothetical protein
MPVNKAIFWPLSQEISQSPVGKGFAGTQATVSRMIQAPLEGEAVDQAPVLFTSI